MSIPGSAPNSPFTPFRAGLAGAPVLLLGLGLGCSSGGAGGFSGDAADAMTAPATAEAGTSASDGAGPGTMFFAGDASPDASGCQPGVYSGSYQGVNDSSKTGGPSAFPISGPLTIHLVMSQQQLGELTVLVTDQGTFDATWGGLSTGDAASGLITIHADLTGQLDCASDAFDATSTDGSWTFLSIPQGDAMLDFRGSYDESTATIAGPFTIVSGTSMSTGTWQVSLGSPIGDP